MRRSGIVMLVAIVIYQSVFVFPAASAGSEWLVDTWHRASPERTFGGRIVVKP